MRGVDPWRSPDPLGEALHFLRMTGSFYVRSELGGSWGLGMPVMDDALWFHIVVSGRCLLAVPGAEPRYLVPGEFALVPHGIGHVLASDAESAQTAPVVYDVPHEYVSDRYAVIRQGAGEEKTTLMCGVVRLDHPAAQQLIGLLPPLIVVDADPAQRLSRMHTILGLVAEEAGEQRPGGEAVITRLSDVLVILALRAWIENDPAARSGWLGALQDKQIGAALALIHRQPDSQWSVESLASSVNMSRSAFAARFTELVGESAMKYVARWRMQTAYETLRGGDVTVAELARRSGYLSEAAFSRAFKRYIGCSPGSVRTRETVSMVS